MSIEEAEYPIHNKFELCLIANERAKKLISGAKTNLGDNKKPTITALEEIKQNLINIEELRKIIINGEKADEPNISPEIKQSTQESFELEEETEFY